MASQKLESCSFTDPSLLMIKSYELFILNDTLFITYYSLLIPHYSLLIIVTPHYLLHHSSAFQFILVLIQLIPFTGCRQSGLVRPSIRIVDAITFTRSGQDFL